MNGVSESFDRHVSAVLDGANMLRAAVLSMALEVIAAAEREAAVEAVTELAEGMKGSVQRE